jgi:4-hydroxybenzoate polyprenyltransferase
LKSAERFFQHFFFGNYFYGCCVVALAIEANLQQGYPLNKALFYVLLFAGTVLYYTHAYLTENNQPNINPRHQWYRQQQKWVYASQWVLTILIASIGIYLCTQWVDRLSEVTIKQWLSLSVFPLLAIWYYGDRIPFVKGSSLRSLGWIKPFVIGFIWAGIVTIYPAFFSALENNRPYQPEIFHLLLFIKNGMFITMLCILFDIKDYAADHNQQLKTFVVRYGLRKTLFFIIIPLTLVGLGTFLTYGFAHAFPPLRMVINTIPFILLIIVTYHMHRRKSILYYLAIIDGLMLVKALCGITGSFISIR